MLLDVYRFEAPDGSGPFYNLDGTSKRGGRDFPADEYRCGNDSVEHLHAWFGELGMHPENNGYEIVHYVVDIKDKNRYNKMNGHVTFSIYEVVEINFREDYLCQNGLLY